MPAPKANIHTVSILVANKPGVLVRCAQVFARRGFNIDALVVSESVNPQFSRMTITAQGDRGTLEQIIKQTSKLIDVIHCSEHTGVDSIDYELALIKVKQSAQSKDAASALVKKYGATIVDQSDQVIIFSLAGTTNVVDRFEEELKQYDILEMVRSGKLVMAKGTIET